MPYHPIKKLIAASAMVCLASGLFVSESVGQQKKDPTAQTPIIEKTLAKIREVEKLDKYIEANKNLIAEKKNLQKTLKDLQAKVNSLSKQMKQQQDTLRKQLLQMPKFEVEAKIIGKSAKMAILKSNNGTILIRANTKMSVPVNGAWVLMEVRKITKDMIELYFPELKRPVYLND